MSKLELPEWGGWGRGGDGDGGGVGGGGSVQRVRGEGFAGLPFTWAPAGGYPRGNCHLRVRPHSRRDRNVSQTLFFKLRLHSHTIQSTHLQCASQWCV